MIVIFLTMSRVTDITQRGIYMDLMRKFQDMGHSVYIVTPHERSSGRPTEFVKQNGAYILGVKTLNLQKSSVIEKGIGQVLVEYQYSAAILKYLKDIQFDLILYSTPPISFSKVIKFLKKHSPKAKSYLLLKDIFPQNAVDLGLMKKNGVKGVLFKYFKNKEKTLYGLSDHIGCMSPANVDYLLRHNPEITSARVEVAPNSIELVQHRIENKEQIREKYLLPTNCPVFIYGGNLGKPQGIPYLIKCLEANGNRDDCHFVVVGTGTDLPLLKQWYTSKRPRCVTVLDGLPKDEYDQLVRACNVGLIFLDHRFTIPNYPSRLLSYLENKMPVLCATDPNTDIGRIAEENGYGYWCESNSVEAFTAILDRMIHSDREAMGEKGYEFLKNNYLVDNTYKVIMQHFESSK